MPTKVKDRFAVGQVARPKVGGDQAIIIVSDPEKLMVVCAWFDKEFQYHEKVFSWFEINIEED